MARSTLKMLLDYACNSERFAILWVSMAYCTECSHDRLFNLRMVSSTHRPWINSVVWSGNQKSILASYLPPDRVFFIFSCSALRTKYLYMSQAIVWWKLRLLPPRLIVFSTQLMLHTSAFLSAINSCRNKEVKHWFYLLFHIPYISASLAD